MIICVPESGGTTPLNCVIKSMTCFQNELGCIRGRKCVEIMKKVIKLEGGSNEEVAEHLEKIKECLKNKKGKN